MDHKKTTDRLKAFLKMPLVLIGGFISLVSTIYGFLKLFVEQDIRLLIYIILAVLIFIVFLICLYYAFFGKPEFQDTGSSIISLPTNVLIKSQKKREKKQRIVRYFSFIGLILIPTLTIFGFKSWQYVQNLPSKDINILVADFDGPDSQKGYRVAAIIRDNLRKATTQYANIKVKALEKPITEQQGSEIAREEGKKQKATIVIWGWYGKTKDIVPISAHFELLNWPSFSHIPITLANPIDLTTKQVLVLPIAQLEKSIIIQTYLSNEMTNLTLLTLGISHSFTEDWEAAIEEFTNALSQMQNGKNRISTMTKAKVLTLLGNARSFQGNLTGALADANEAIRIEPNNASAYILRSFVRISQNNEQGALADIDTAIKLAPKASEIYLSRCIIRGLYFQALLARVCLADSEMPAYQTS
jgi:tetratricopeptide (TPR) repeat protein